MFNFLNIFAAYATLQAFLKGEKLIKEAQQKMRELRDKRFQKELDELNKSKEN